MLRIAVIAGVLHSGGKRNLIMEYYRHIDRTKVQYDLSAIQIQMVFPKKKSKLWVGEYIRWHHIRILLHI